MFKALLSTAASSTARQHLIPRNAAGRLHCSMSSVACDGRLFYMGDLRARSSSLSVKRNTSALPAMLNPALPTTAIQGYRVRSRAWYSTTTTTTSAPPTSSGGGEEATTKNEPQRSTTRRKRFQRMDEVPSLRDFMHRQTVLALYRKFMRLVHDFPDRKELQAQIKREFNAMRHETDGWNQKRAVKEGQRRLKDLQTTVSTSATVKRGHRQEQQQQQDEGSVAKDDNDKNDDGSPKVGKGWPWERKN